MCYILNPHVLVDMDVDMNNVSKTLDYNMGSGLEYGRVVPVNSVEDVGWHV